MEFKHFPSLVAVATCTILIFFNFTNASGFKLERRIIRSSSFFGTQINVSTERHQLLRKAITPSYLHDLFKLAEKSINDSVVTNQNDQFLRNLLDGVNSDSCKGHVAEWYWRWFIRETIGSEKEKWVLQMVDAWAKIPEGILSGHVNSYGDFHECVQIEVKDLEILNTVYPEKDIPKNFDGQYCTSYLLDYDTSMSLTPKPIGGMAIMDNGIHESLSLEEFLKIFAEQPANFLIMMIPSMGVCLPNSCSVSDVQQILVNGLNIAYSTFTPTVNRTSMLWPVTINCADSHKPGLDGAAIAVIILLVILVTLGVISGLLDYWYSHTSTSSEKGSAAPQGVIYKYLMAFSIYTNTKKLLSTRRSGEDLGCLHGIRFFSTAWVVLGHTYLVFMQGPQWNMIDMRNVHKNWTVLAVINATFSVDTFFVMSGMLATYNVLKMLDKTKGKINIIMFYVHRYVRLTPTYAILVGIGATLLTYTGQGPNWHTMERYEENCRNNWWTNILYINNLVNANEMCNGESWYLANDMQFYILSPLIIYPIWKWKGMGLLLLAVYTAMSCISQVLVVQYATDASAAMILTGDMGTGAGTTEIYRRPWSRISTFLVGVWLGWLLHKTRGKRVNLSWPLVSALWLSSTGIALAVVFGIHPWFDPENKIPTVPGYFYAGLSRFSWAVAISIVIFACVKGYGGIVNTFLSWKGFMPLGRLCFCVYLTSMHVQEIFHSRLAVPIKWDTYTAVNIYFAHMVMSYIVGFACTLLFESPFIILQKLIFEGNGGGSKQSKPANLVVNSSGVVLNIENNNNVEKPTKTCD